MASDLAADRMAWGMAVVDREISGLPAAQMATAVAGQKKFVVARHMIAAVEAGKGMALEAAIARTPEIVGQQHSG